MSTLLYAYYSVEVSGNFSAEIRFKNIKNSRINRRKTVKKLRKQIQVNLKKKFYKNFFKLKFVFHENTNQSQKCVFENIVHVSRH